MIRVDWHCLCGDALASHADRPEGPECHGHCQGTPLDCKGLGFRPIDQTRRNPAIAAIFAEARSKFLPRAYTCDLSSDYQTLTGWNPKAQRFEEPYEGRFIWVLRENGTEFYRLDDVNPEYLSYALAAYKYWTGEGRGEEALHAQHVYLWDATGLNEIRPAQGEFLIEDTRYALDPLNY